MRAQVLVRFFAITAITLSLTACGGSNVSSPIGPVNPSAPPTTLTGNWFLAGSSAAGAYPIIATSLYVNGNVVAGQASISTMCATTGSLPFTETGTSELSLRGTVASDGTFQASTGTVGDPALGTISLSLTGSSPVASSPTVWSGAYSLVETQVSTAPSCGTTQSANFVATPIAPVTGTYVGAPANPGSAPEAFGSTAVVSVEITQGLPVPVTRGGTSIYVIPLTATLTINNSPCAISASTTSVTTPSTVGGTRLELAFATATSPGQGFLSGTLDSPSASSFLGNLTFLANSNGCPGIATYEFTRK